jgi:ClpP class serine protease
VVNDCTGSDVRLDIKPQPAPAVIFFSGRIVDTDRVRMEKALEDAARVRPKPEVVIALHSPGGDHFARLRIALLLQRTAWEPLSYQAPRARALAAPSSSAVLI